MDLSRQRKILVIIGIVGVLLLASPTINLFVKLPAGQEFSDLYVLGPNHTFDGIPFNIKVGVTNSIYLGVGNNMGSTEYYTCSIKIGNESAIPPNSTTGTASPLPVLYQYNSLVIDKTTYETPLTFRVDQVTFDGGGSQLSGVNINGIEYSMNLNAAWDSNKTGYYYNLFVELSIYNSTLGTTQYNNRYARLILNMTQ